MEKAEKKTEDELRARAMRLLARREHTRIELGHKLKPYAENEADVNTILDDFSERGLVSDARFAEQFIHSNQKKFGNIKLAYALREKGVSSEVAQALLSGNKSSELDAARIVWRRKFREPPKDAAEKAKQMRFLQSRGFTSETIRKVFKASRHEADE